MKGQDTFGITAFGFWTLGKRNGLIVLLLFLIGFIACQRSERVDPTGKGRTVVTYWNAWTSAEAEALANVVNAFNNSQNEIYVDMVTVSDLDNKLLVAITGQDPPDVANILWMSAHKYAAKRALEPLDQRMAAVGLSADRYIPSIWDLCVMNGVTWSLPLTPSSIALHWNKDLFAKAGLDPEHPPQTIAELDAMSKQLDVLSPDGHILQMGFLPPEPGWWRWNWGFYFGGQLWNGKDRFTIDSPENCQAFQWMAGFAERYGRKRVEAFRGGFGNFDSPDNAFMAGKLAMVVQGVWMDGFINRHNPTLHYGVAPFPCSDPNREAPSYVEADMIVIPRGSRHPDEAFKFIEWTQRQDMLELLNLGQHKFTPLKETSPGFFEQHPHPFIQVFVDLANRPSWFSTPKTVLVSLALDEVGSAHESVWMGTKMPKDALSWVQNRLQPQLDRVRASIHEE